MPHEKPENSYKFIYHLYFKLSLIKQSEVYTELLRYSTFNKSSILVSLTTNKKKDRCGVELIIHNTNTLIAYLWKNLQLFYPLEVIRTH